MALSFVVCHNTHIIVHLFHTMPTGLNAFYETHVPKVGMLDVFRYLVETDPQLAMVMARHDPELFPPLEIWETLIKQARSSGGERRSGSTPRSEGKGVSEVPSVANRQDEWIVALLRTGQMPSRILWTDPKSHSPTRGSVLAWATSMGRHRVRDHLLQNVTTKTWIETVEIENVGRLNLAGLAVRARDWETLAKFATCGASFAQRNEIVPAWTQLTHHHGDDFELFIQRLGAVNQTPGDDKDIETGLARVHDVLSNPAMNKWGGSRWVKEWRGHLGNWTCNRGGATLALSFLEREAIAHFLALSPPKGADQPVKTKNMALYASVMDRTSMDRALSETSEVPFAGTTSGQWSLQSAYLWHLWDRQQSRLRVVFEEITRARYPDMVKAQASPFFDQVIEIAKVNGQKCTLTLRGLNQALALAGLADASPWYPQTAREWESAWQAVLMCNRRKNARSYLQSCGGQAFACLRQPLLKSTPLSTIGVDEVPVTVRLEYLAAFIRHGVVPTSRAGVDLVHQWVTQLPPPVDALDPKAPVQVLLDSLTHTLVDATKAVPVQWAWSKDALTTAQLIPSLLTKGAQLSNKAKNGLVEAFARVGVTQAEAWLALNRQIKVSLSSEETTSLHPPRARLRP